MKEPHPRGQPVRQRLRHAVDHHNQLVGRIRRFQDRVEGSPEYRPRLEYGHHQGDRGM
jgi:hypothetical protein